MSGKTLNTLRRYLCHEQWAIGLIPQSAGDIIRHGIRRPVQWRRPDTDWALLADPFLVEMGGATLVFMEHLDYRREAGEIWSGRLEPGADFAAMALSPAISATAHLSYPCPFFHHEKLYLLCESWERYGASIYAEGDSGWELRATLLDGRPAVDATLHQGDDGTWWLFCTFQDDGPNERLHLFHAASPFGAWRAHGANPVKSDIAAARPAGKLFSVDGELYRPAQDCSKTYGGAIAINRVTALTPDRFEEERVRTIEPQQPFPHGVHTFSPGDGFTVIDGKRWVFHPLELFRKIARLPQVRARRKRLRQEAARR